MQASRRMARRIYYDLSHRNLGYVRIAVAAYTHLITSDEGSFARLYTKELIIKYPAKQRHIWSIGPRPAPSKLPLSSAYLGSVIGSLISSPELVAQHWGLELLITLLKQQNTAEFVSNFERLVPTLCNLATTNAKSVSNLGSSVEQDRESSPTNVTAALSLQALLEHLRMCLRLSYVSLHLDSVTYCVLGIIDAEEGISDMTSYATAAEAMASGISPLSLSKNSIGSRVGASSPGLAALLVYHELSYMTRDAAEGKKVLEFLFRFLDQRPERWLGGPTIDVGLGVMREACSHEHQRYLLASSLLSHAGKSESLPSKERQAVLNQAMKDVLELEPSMMPSALLLALQELPKAVHGSVENEVERALMETILSAISALAERLSNRLQLTSVLGASLSRLAAPTVPTATTTLRCCAAAAAAYADLPMRTPGASAPPHLPNVLLRAAFGVCLGWNPQQRLLAHEILRHAMGSVPLGSYPAQVHLLLSSLWHEVALPENNPALFAAMDVTLGSALAASHGSEEQVDACCFAVSLQKEIAAAEREDGVSRFGALNPAQRWAVLALCSSLWTKMAHRFGHEKLQDLALLQDDDVRSLPSLNLENSGLKIAGEVALAARNSRPDAGHDVLFTEEDSTSAAQILSSLASHLTNELQNKENIKVLLTAVPALKSLSSAALALGFSPLSTAAICPHVTLSTVSLSSKSGIHRPASPRAKRLQTAFSAPLPETPSSSSLAGTALGSDMAVAGSRFAMDAQGMETEESVSGFSRGRDGAASEVGSVGKQLQPETLADVLAGVETALASVAS